MTLRHSLLILGGVLMVAVLTGCQRDRVKAPGVGRLDPLPAEAYPQISPAASLEQWLYFTDPIIESGPDQPLNVSVPVRLAYDQGIHVQYRFEFYDRNGELLQPVMGWRHQFMPARNQVQLSGGATDTNAADWRLVIRPSP